MPNLFLIAGPNGAGKSTSAPELLAGPRRVAEFVNADDFQRDESLSELAAGRRALERLDALTAAGKDIAFESTLATALLRSRIRRMQAAGYRFHLFFLWLPSADMAVQRVAARVAAGGHAIPEHVIRRRYERGLRNLFEYYLPLADSWFVVENTARPSRTIAWRPAGGAVHIMDNQLWNHLTAGYMSSRAEEQTAEYQRRDWTPTDIEAAIDRAVTGALRRHKERGESVIMWREGQIIKVQANDIKV